MRKAGLIIILFFSFLTACAEKGASDNAANSTSVYKNEAAEPQTQNYSANTSTTSNTAVSRGSGGGGGGRDEKPIVFQQLSLNQAENSQNPPVAPAADRKIIRNADLSLESDKPDEAQQKITTIAESKGGFVVESQQSTSDARKTSAARDTVTMSVRVPAAKFNEALDEIRKTASRVIVETVKGEDVTEQFIDIEANLKAKKALEQQFLEIMKQARSVEDALEVQSQLASVRGEIEKIEGRKRFLENQASLSTIKIKLQTPAAFSQNSSGFFYQFGDAFGRGFDAALSFILGFVTFIVAILPFLLLVVLPLYLVIRYFMKRLRKQKSANEIAREEIKSE